MQTPHPPNFEQSTKPAPVPVVPGNFDRLPSKRLLRAPEDIPKTLDPTTRECHRRWIACGAVIVVSSMGCANAFRPQTDKEVMPAPTCKTIAAREIAKNLVLIQLDRSAGKEEVWVGNYTGAMQAQTVPGYPTYYRLETAGYLHNDIISVSIGYQLCNNRVTLGGVYPGDEQVFAP